MLEMLNYWVVLVAAIAGFVLGGVWYSPIAFGKIWSHESGVDPSKTNKAHAVLVYGISFILSLITATVFAIFLGVQPAFFFAVGMGFATGLAWVATSLGMNYLFAGRSMKLLLIDAGYHTAQFTLYGIIFGLWH